jgi:type III pantothenate kinase
MENLELIAVSVGNTRTRLGVFRDNELEQTAIFINSDEAALAKGVLDAKLRDPKSPIVIASVNPPISTRLEMSIVPEIERRGGEVFRIGRDLGIPIANALTDDSTVGQDRLLNALGAYSRAKQACIVVDAGTAVTVDFVDGQGVFQGGAIAPGLSMMLWALHNRTAALPEIAFEPLPPEEPFGKDTARAMRLGVQSAVRGMVRLLSERYAEAFGAYPQIIATGGDAAVLFESDEVIEHIVPNLTLMGIQAACEIELSDGDGPTDE